MAGAEGVEDVAVVLAALVGVADQQRDRRAGGQALVHAGQDLHRIGLVALRHVAAGAGAAPVQVGLDVGLGQRHAGRAAVDDAADGRAMAFAEVGDAEQFAEGAAGHGLESQARREPMVPSVPRGGRFAATTPTQDAMMLVTQRCRRLGAQAARPAIAARHMVAVICLEPLQRVGQRCLDLSRQHHQLLALAHAALRSAHQPVGRQAHRFDSPLVQSLGATDPLAELVAMCDVDTGRSSKFITRLACRLELRRGHPASSFSQCLAVVMPVTSRRARKAAINCSVCSSSSWIASRSTLVRSASCMSESSMPHSATVRRAISLVAERTSMGLHLHGQVDVSTVRGRCRSTAPRSCVKRSPATSRACSN